MTSEHPVNTGESQGVTRMAASGRERRVLFLVALNMLAFGATAMFYYLVEDRLSRTDPMRPADKGEVVVAAANIAPGWTIEESHLQVREMLVEYIPEEVYRTKQEVMGRVAMERILYGEFIREERLAEPEAGTGLAAIIPRGMRAYQVKVAGGAQLSGFLNPGNFVDVIAVCVEANPPEVRTILRSVTVLAVDDRMVDTSFDEDGGGKKKKKVKPSVTLALTPTDTELVKAADAQCEISLALRNDIDVTNIETNDEEEDDLGPAEAPGEESSGGATVPESSTGWLRPSDRPSLPSAPLPTAKG